MPRFTVRDLLRATHGALVAGDLAVAVSGVSIDSRTLAVGDAFFAIRGHSLDGHRYLADAAGRGAACFVVHALPDDVPSTVPLVMVDDTTKALGRLAAWYRGRYTIPVVAVTGSNGKTTTKEMIAAVLATTWSTHRPEGSFNNQWGLPLTLLAVKPEHEAIVVELGANQPGEIAALAAIARPTVGVVTTVAAVHTEFFGSLDGVRDEKAALVRALGADGHAVLNADDARVAGMASETAASVVTYGRAKRARVRAVGDVAEDEHGLRFTIELDGRRQPVRLAFAGRHNVGNALAAAGVGVALGLPLETIARGLEAARPAKGRCIWRHAGGVSVLDDTYNANPVSVAAALETVLAHRAGRRLVVVLADMLELGAVAEDAHREVGRHVGRLAPDVFIGVGPHMALAVEEARGAGVVHAYHATTFEDTMAEVGKRVEPGDVVLVKGSRGIQTDQVIDRLVGEFG